MPVPDSSAAIHLKISQLPQTGIVFISMGYQGRLIPIILSTILPATRKLISLIARTAHLTIAL
jgi:hypothetical protein